MADLYLQQAEADEMLYFLAVDYKRILESVDSALAYRRRALKLLQKEIKKNGSSKVRCIIPICQYDLCCYLTGRDRHGEDGLCSD